MMLDAHMRLNPELPWKKHHPTRRLFLLLNWTLYVDVVKCYIWSIAFVWC
jgi:hypothetical protein